MAYANLLNAMCRLERLEYDNSSQNEFNEEEDDPVLVADNIPCRLEKLYDRELVEAYGGGDHDKGIYVLYTKMKINIRSSDLITVYETVKISGFSDTVVNGVYKRSEDDSINDKPVYVHTSGDYRLINESGKWIIQKIDDGDELFQSSGDSLDDKNWTVLNGTGTTGKSIERIIQDFHYNTDNKPTQLIVNDVEDAGGGHGHHLQSFCRYRKELN